MTVAGTVNANKSARRNKPFLRALAFMAPALFLLGALVVAPIFATVFRSLFDRSGDSFIGVDNYVTIFENDSTRNALKNNLIWVVFAPTIATALGLVFAVLSERVRWQTAFKLCVFMPMAISFLAAGVIFRVVYDGDPRQGLANAAIHAAHNIVSPDGKYNGVRSNNEALLKPDDGGFVTAQSLQAGSVTTLPLIGLPVDRIPASALPAAAPVAVPDAINGTVWLDFTRGGGGKAGTIDSTEDGLGGIPVVAKSADAKLAGSATTKDDGSFSIEGLDAGESYTLALGKSAFAPPFNGYEWLGPSLITASVIGAYIWIWAGFAMIVIGAGLAALPRDVLEAARVDGANEWQVFRRITAPLLMPVLAVVLVTLVINVLKIFDLIMIIPPGSSQDDASVIAFEMWNVSFGGGRDQGLGSALSVVLFLLVVPAMMFNIRRFKAGNS